MADILNNPPIRSQVVDQSGRMTQPWAAWLLVLYRRVGEALGRSTTAIDADVSSLSGGTATLDSRMASAESRLAALEATPPLPAYTVSTVPAASPAGRQIFVTNESGGAVPAFSDGSDWRRVTDRAVIS